MVSQRRVVVTGLGLVTSLGTDVGQTWKRLVKGDCGIISLLETPQSLWSPKLSGQRNTSSTRNEDFSTIPCPLASPVLRGDTEGLFNEDEWIPKTIRHLSSPFIQFAIASSTQALTDANWKASNEIDQYRTGVCFGTGMGSMTDCYNSYKTVCENGTRRLSAYTLPRMLNNLAAGQISIQNKFMGPVHCATTACTTGAHSIGDAARFIMFGDADVMVAGASESSINLTSLGLFGKVRAMPDNRFNACPQEASRPFDRHRAGFIMGEGAGALVLEEYEHAKKRNAHIYAELIGYGLSGDAYHVTGPHTDGLGALWCMQQALRQADIPPHLIDYINAHATSTPLGDSIENLAIKNLLQDDNEKRIGKEQISVSSIKGAIGHTLGAAGAIEAISTILSLVHNTIPPTLNLHETDDPDTFDLDYTPLVAKQKEIQYAISNSFGFGGTNVSLLFSKL